MKTSISLILFTFMLGICETISGQETRKYFTKVGIETTRDHASYYTIFKSGQETMGYADAMNSFDTVSSYYVSDILKSKYVMNRLGVRVGYFAEYYENGNLSIQGNLYGGHYTDTLTEWYSNGQLWYQKFFPQQPSKGRDPYQIIHYFDSTGVQLVNNGNGYCVCKFFREGDVVENGKVRDGWRDSTWNGYRKGALIYSETFNYGVLLHGIGYTDEGEFPYTAETREVMPQPVGGMANVYRMISKKLKYPAEARKKGYQGTVYVGFIINTNGKLSDFNIVRGVHPLLDAEAIRVMQLMDRWEPGMQWGRKIRVKYVLPIMFKLAE